jgi:two-component system response regulator DesR
VNTGPRKIRVLIAEDQTMLRGALAALLDLEPDISVVGQAANGNEALRLVRDLAPDIVVTDIEMPQRTGLEFAAALKDTGAKARVIILTTFARPGYLRRALEAGAHGYLLKERPASELAEAIRRVHAGLRAVDPTLAAEAWAADEDPLSDRERSILQRAGDGRTYSASPKAPSATTSPKPSPNSAPQTAPTPPASPAPRAGSDAVSRSPTRPLPSP